MMISLSKTSTLPPKGWQKAATEKKTKTILAKLSELQNLLFANKTHSVLVILQGMDASGKDGVLKNVFNRFNPRNLKAYSFDVPTEEEKAHDFLWRVHQQAPAKGMIQIFNRSHYEDILVTRVRGWCSDDKAKQRMKAINAFEHLLHTENNTQILKFYLHTSKEEQEKRLQERKDEASKHWKYDANDYKELALRDEYIRMYEEVLKHCNEFPWTVVPADKNWYREYLIAKALLDAMEALQMTYPPLAADAKA